MKFLLLSILVGIVFSYEFTVFYDSKLNNFHLSPFKIDTTQVAHGVCSMTLDETGWDRYNVHSNPEFDDDIQMRAIGYADGHCFQERIWNHYHNVYSYFVHSTLNHSDFDPRVHQFLRENQQYVRKNMNKETAFWKQVKHVVDQFDGIWEGYNARAPFGQELTKEQLWLYQSFGELIDLKNKYILHDLKPYPDKYKRYLKEYDWDTDDHCSGLTKLGKQNSDIFIGQNAFFSYTAMIRTAKSIETNLMDRTTKAQRFTFSSYPGFVYSFDDFMVSDQKIVAFETTIHFYDPKMFDLVVPTSVMTWIRCRVAMQGAESGKQWSQMFDHENSGTYNNQWHILDYKEFTKGKSPKEGTLWILEQMPGKIEAKDMTEFLKTHKYFPSYNVPYHKNIYDACGYPKQFNDSATYRHYDDCPRARLFRNNHASAETFDGFKKLMRRNNYKNDPESLMDPGQAIMARYDLRNKTAGPRCYGGLDSKVINTDLANSVGMLAIGSPTYGDSDIKVWDFNEDNFTLCHKELRRVGVPVVSNFNWTTYTSSSKYNRDNRKLTKGQVIAIVASTSVLGVIIIGLAIAFVIASRNKAKRYEGERLLGNPIDSASI